MATSVKRDRIASIIMRSVSETLQFEISDPDIGFITITDVALTNDLSIAKIYIMFYDKRNVEKTMRALDRAKGRIRSRLAKQLSIRKCPELIFVHDESVERGNRIDRIIQEINEKNKD